MSDRTCGCSAASHMDGISDVAKVLGGNVLRLFREVATV